ncbi:hypothetical protein D1BOALGB6SA_10188 [Olavius sp. associated proteobacterium Delta 1]|nr:hypothetical protein D1BOALGB6SA_10188 [Olavius sp. associated proteobacterium Delta 1]
MSSETNRANQPMSTVQKSRSIFRDIADYLKTRMDDYPNRSSFRITVYLLEGILIGLSTYLWLEYAQMGKLYHWLFPIIVSSAIVGVHYTITETVYKFWKPSKKTLGIFWMISFAGIVMSFLLVYLTGICGFVCQITGSYCPAIWHTSPPDTIAVFFKTAVLPWVISISWLTQAILKKEMAKELANIKQINASLDQKKLEIKSQRVTINDESEKHSDSLGVPSKDGIIKIAFVDLYFIAVEDHYCKFVFNRKGKIYNEYVRLSLKEALANLPSSHFAQVHRSYAVNLQHVKHIKKEGQAYQLFIEGSDDFLPASRHRAHTFLPKLRGILN